MSRAKKVTGAKLDALHERMSEYLSNYQAQRKPKSSPKRVAYDWAKKRVVNAERAAHRKCFGLSGEKARENFDSIFRR